MWVKKAEGMSQPLQLELSIFFSLGYFLGVLYMPQFNFGKLSLVLSGNLQQSLVICYIPCTSFVVISCIL